MTLLEKTYKILQQKDKKKLEPKEKYDWFNPLRPEYDFRINPFNIPKNRQQVKVKEYLSKALAFIDMKKYTRFSDGYTVMAISCKNKRILSMFNKSHQRASRWIDYLVQIGLLAEYDRSYRFRSPYEGENYCKLYVYSYEAENKLKEYCKQNDINKFQLRNSTRKIEKVYSIESFDKEAVRFNSKLNLLKPDNWSCTKFEEYLTQCLYENYPQLEYYQQLADTINETYYAKDLDRQIQFTPTFGWRKGNKCVTSIGIRATNCLVSAKKEHEEGDEERHIKLYKDEVFDKYGLKFHYDVTSSVPRLTYMLNHGEWLDDDIDLYEEMYKRFVEYCPEEKVEWNKETRKIFKSFHMRGYFDTTATVAAHIKRQIAMKVDYEREEWDSLDIVMKSYKMAIENTVGKLYDSEIFFHESCIYMDVLYELLQRKIKVWQVYDEWNTNKEVKDIKILIKAKVVGYCSKKEWTITKPEYWYTFSKGMIVRQGKTNTAVSTDSTKGSLTNQFYCSTVHSNFIPNECDTHSENDTEKGITDTNNSAKLQISNYKRLMNNIKMMGFG